MSPSDALSNATPPSNAQSSSLCIYMMLLCYDLLVRVIHNYISVWALCVVCIQNTYWMNILILKYSESLKTAVICEHMRICSFIYRLVIKWLKIYFGNRQAQVKSCIWHVKIVQSKKVPSLLLALVFYFLR